MDSNGYSTVLPAVDESDTLTTESSGHPQKQNGSEASFITSSSSYTGAHGKCRCGHVKVIASLEAAWLICTNVPLCPADEQPTRWDECKAEGYEPMDYSGLVSRRFEQVTLLLSSFILFSLLSFLPSLQIKV